MQRLGQQAVQLRAERAQTVRGHVGGEHAGFHPPGDEDLLELIVQDAGDAVALAFLSLGQFGGQQPQLAGAMFGQSRAFHDPLFQDVVPALQLFLGQFQVMDVGDGIEPPAGVALGVIDGASAGDEPTILALTATNAHLVFQRLAAAKLFLDPRDGRLALVGGKRLRPAKAESRARRQTGVFVIAGVEVVGPAIGQAGGEDVGDRLGHEAEAFLAVGQRLGDTAVFVGGTLEFGGTLPHAIFQGGRSGLQLRVAPFQVQLDASQGQVRAHAHQHLLAVEGFGQVVDPTHLEGAHLVSFFSQGTEEDDRNGLGLRIRLKASADFIAVQSRHANVKKNEGRRLGTDAAQRQFAVAGGTHLVTGSPQDVRQEP